ncbi:MAG: hypothetical protein AVDCRST_MAG34-414, partial [uncultured Nocardioidaceae bacterium]
DEPRCRPGDRRWSASRRAGDVLPRRAESAHDRWGRWPASHV